MLAAPLPTALLGLTLPWGSEPGWASSLGAAPGVSPGLQVLRAEAAMTQVRTVSASAPGTL